MAKTCCEFTYLTVKMCRDFGRCVIYGQCFRLFLQILDWVLLLLKRVRFVVVYALMKVPLCVDNAMLSVMKTPMYTCVWCF